MLHSHKRAQTSKELHIRAQNKNPPKVQGISVLSPYTPLFKRLFSHSLIFKIYDA